MDWEFSVAATSWSGDSMAYGQCWPRIIQHPTAIATMETRISERRRVFVPSKSFSSRSRMGNRFADAHARDAAVAQRLHSAPFGGGETRMQMRSFANLGRLTKCATPLPISL